MESNYKLVFPKLILEHGGLLSFEATKTIKYQIAGRDIINEIFVSFNLAWQKFINDPLDYVVWGKMQREKYDVYFKKRF